MNTVVIFLVSSIILEIESFYSEPVLNKFKKELYISKELYILSKILSYLESEGEIFMRGRVEFERQKCSFLVMTTFLDFQGFQGKEKQNDGSIKL